MAVTLDKPIRAAHASIASAQAPGRLVRVMSNQELLADMRAHGREVSKTRESAVAFLQRAGILDNTGVLAEPYRP